VVLLGVQARPEVRLHLGAEGVEIDVEGAGEVDRRQTGPSISRRMVSM
jgi:hypothetical protein